MQSPAPRHSTAMDSSSDRSMDPGQDDISAGDKLQLQLLLIEEDQRSSVMWRQTVAFQEKVTLCLNTFKPETLLVHVRALSSLSNQNPILATSIHSLARLRMVVQQQLRRANMRSDGSIYFPAEQESSLIARCTQYFDWFFEFMDYLSELHSNFVERIFLPLFKFFHEISFLSSQSRTSTSGSIISKLSLLSLDSDETEDNDNNNDVASVDIVRRRIQSRSALMLLSKEFADIKTLYDTSEMDRIAQRLSFLKEQVDFMLEQEDELDPDLFSVDSGQLLFPLQMDEGTENLVRLPLDLLIKFRKAAWLARRWLELYDKRTHDLNLKLSKVLTLEENMSKRLQTLDDDIVLHERQLERNIEELHRLLKREERSEGLSFKLYDLDAKSKALKAQLEQLRKRRDVITAKIVEVTQKGNVHEYRKIKVEFEKNKLQRYLVERQMATVSYQLELSSQDRHVELQVRPSLIYFSNHVQDTCERLEKTIREEKQERENIRSALLPIQEDRQILRDKLSRLSSVKDGSSSRSEGPLRGLRAGEAKFIRSYNANNRYERSSQSETYRVNKPISLPGWISPPEW